MNYALAHNTDTGTRKTNQDRAAYRESKHGVLMVVADGLGGYPGGEMAAQTVVDCLIDSYAKQGDAIVDDPAAFIVLSMTYAHTLINKKARAEGVEEENLPRTTCVACLVQNGYAYWGHVGDSRLYLFTDGELSTRTIDHTTADHMHQDGVIDEQVQRLGHSQLFRCVGGTMRPVVSLGPETHLGTGDSILMCTDGIWRAFKESRLTRVARGDSLEDAVEALIAHAERYFRAECDNLTALMFRWNAAPSLHKPLLNQNTSELDQDTLWRARKKSARTTRPVGGKPAARIRAADAGCRTTSEGIDSVIKEIESLVDELDRTYELKPGGKTNGSR